MAFFCLYFMTYEKSINDFIIAYIEQRIQERDKCKNILENLEESIIILDGD